MYKKFFMGIAAMAALTLVSCSSDDLNSLSDNSSKNEAISFDGYWGRSAVSVNDSRGSVIDKAEDLQNISEGFGVFGNYTSTDVTTTTYGENLFKNQQVTYNATAETPAWTYKPVKYWSPAGHIDFLAYAPFDSNQKLKESSKLDFTVNSTITAQKDLLWANAANKTNTDKPVTFIFNHALSRLGYTVKTNAAAEGTTITLNQITLAGSNDGAKGAFYSAGIIDLSKTSSTDLWTNLNSDTKLKFDWVSSNKELSSTETKNDETEYLFVIPQNFSQKTTSADALYVVVEYTISYSDQTTMKTKVYQKLEKNFEQGKAYTLNLTIGLTPIEFDATVDTWTDINQGEINSWN
ncbi:fimbrillin family protein [Segatella copri]|uniref:fimbrillin family protein n=1 Tax=Segatella copri TaxID=165179 RepID=UPI002FF0F097